MASPSIRRRHRSGVATDLAGCRVGGYDLCMASEKRKAIRRFTVFELLLYVSAFSLAIGIFRARYEVEGHSLPPLMGYCYALASIAAVCLLGSLIGIAIAMLLVGRRCVRLGAVSGAVAFPLLLFVAGIIYMDHARRQSRQNQVQQIRRANLATSPSDNDQSETP